MAATKKSQSGSRKHSTANSRTKRGTAKRTTTRRNTTEKKNTQTGRKSATGRRRSIEEINEYKDKLAFELGVTVLVIAILSFFLYLCFLGFAGKAGTVVGGLFFGFFGWFAWLVPVVAILGSTVYLVNRGNKMVWRKIIGFMGIVLSVLGLCDLLFQQQIITEYYTTNHVMHPAYADCMFRTCKDVMEKGKGNAGLIGRAVGTIFSGLIGKIGAVFILLALLVLCIYIFYGMEMMRMLRKRNAYREEMQEVYDQISKEEKYNEPSYRVFQNKGKENSREVFKEHVTSKYPLPKTREEKEEERVLSFDLKKINERLDQMEKAVQESIEEQREQSLQEQSARTANKKAAQKSKKREAATKEPVAMQETATKEPAVMRETATKEPAVMQAEETLSIPIYRNEMRQKFGEHKKTKKPVPKDAAGPEEYFKDHSCESESLEESAADILAKLHYAEENSGKDPKGQSAIKGNIENSFEKHTGSEKNVNDVFEKHIGFEKDTDDVFGEHIGSEKDTDDVFGEHTGSEKDTDDVFGEHTGSEKDTDDVFEKHTGSEKDTDDVFEKHTGSEKDTDDVFGEHTGLEKDADHLFKTQSDFEKNATNQEQAKTVQASDTIPKETAISAGAVAMAQAMAKDRDHTRTVKGHGKFGGDDYVSASDTFNALNESKVAPVDEKPYQFPPLDLLSLPKNAGNAVSDSELRLTAQKLQDTLKSFNVNVKMGAVICGPTVTRYELLPEQGVRVNKITNLADDIKLSMAATSVRIEAPIPGKAAVGIEVPNPTASPVAFRELLEGDTFASSKSDLTFAVGKDIAGKLIMADVGKMPHLLIAGATGSGKSVCINTLIMSILYKADPRDVKLIMIDPKVVELSVYNGIPHLFCPVVTDPKEAAAALNWAVREMGDRYNKFKELGVRNIAGYNEKIKKMEDAQAAGYSKMPYLVVIVDEFADLMMVASKDVEDAVCRLAQLARAAGIHLVLATQRPSVNVITGVIKANIPSRIAFSVSSAIDSRTILDRGGAEKLLGKGDMLFFPTGYSEPIRVQGAFVSDKEVSDVVDFLRENNATPEYDHSVTEIVEEPETEPAEKKAAPENDEYFEDAGRFVIESDRAAAGQLQRRFSIGFNRAGRIIDQLHKAGVVGPAVGTKPRKVLMTMEEFEAMLHGEEIETVDSSSIAQEQEIIESAIIDTEENVATMEEI